MKAYITFFTNNQDDTLSICAFDTYEKMVECSTGSGSETIKFLEINFSLGDLKPVYPKEKI